MEALRLMKKLLFSLVVILLLIITSPAQARGLHVAKYHGSITHAKSVNPFKGFRHTRLTRVYRGSVTIYNK